MLLLIMFFSPDNILMICLNNIPQTLSRLMCHAKVGGQRRLWMIGQGTKAVS